MADGKSTRILASTRRQPPVSVLDSEDWGTPTLFEGPGNSLRVCTKSKILTWNGSDWQEVCAAPPSVFSPIISPDDVLFQSDGWNVHPAQISSLATESSQVEFCLVKGTRQMIDAIGTGPATSQKPLWTLPLEVSLPNLSAAIWQSSLYLMVDHSEEKDIVNEQQHLIVGKTIFPKDGYNAVLFCFSHDLTLPQKVFVKFDASAGCPPMAGFGSESIPITPGIGLAVPWMLFTTNFLLCGRELPDRMGGNSDLAGYKSGIWMIPLDRIDSAIADQKKIQREQRDLSAAAAEQDQKNFFARIDLNHNGIIDPDEREAAMDDSKFIESELDVIDSNHNGWLDPEELAFFDANTNRILEPKEQAGIEIVQHLLAEKLLKKFDADGDGLLEQQEFTELVHFDPYLQAQPLSNFPAQSLKTSFPDANRDGEIDVTELEVFLNQQLLAEIRPREMMGYFSGITHPDEKIDVHQLLKTYVEQYWKKSTPHKNLSDEERRQILQRLMQQRKAEAQP